MTKKNELSDIWSEMVGEKGDLVERSESYARWTIPAIMLPDGRQESEAGYEADKGSVEIGAPVVNHLANRIVDVLFPVSRPFFTVRMTDDTQIALDQTVEEEQAGALREAVHTAMRKIENRAMNGMNLAAYRPMAIEVSKHLAVTGNSLIRVKKDNTRVQYGVNRYGVRRDATGKVIEVMLFDKKRLEAFDEKSQKLIKEVHFSMKPDDVLDLHTHYKLKDGKWLVRQEADGVSLQNDTKVSEKDFDLIVLVWSLAPGENYGRGLVEDMAVAFHKLDVLGEAEMEFLAILTDLKFLVRPGSVLSKGIADLNRSRRGSYHVGVEGDISVPDMGKRTDVQVLRSTIQDSEATVKEAFLMTSVRDAERVTAEEIRMVANQLESTFGGLYSRLSIQWQQPEAERALEASQWRKLVDDADMYEIVVTTGLESLSREGQIDNLRLAIGDMQMLEAVPEEIRAGFHPTRFAKFVAANRSVDVKDIMKTEAEIQAEQEAAMAQAGRMEQQAAGAKAQGAVAEAAGKKAVEGGGQ
tara:strand:- start:232 stop:1809 length:1578 start_codon:yes stop_codon:yes gene_type:complete